MLVAAGLSNAAIAEQLVLTRGTVANHIAGILWRLQLRSRTEVAVWAVEHGLHAGQDRLLASLEQLLNEQPTSARQAMTRLSNVVTEALGADKVDVFVHDAARGALIAVGTSTTPLGRRQRATGLAELPLSSGGRAVQVFEDGRPYLAGGVQSDEKELLGIRRELGVGSQLVVPLEVGGVQRGVVVAQSQRPNFFVGRDLQFLSAASHWVAAVIQRLEPDQHHRAMTSERDGRVAAEELISVVAHDLRNGLAPIRGRLDLLLRTGERQQSSVGTTDLAALREAVSRLERRVDDLLDVSRIEHGLLRLEPSRVDLASLVRESARAFEVPGTIAIHVEAPLELYIIADASRLRQALDNLLANAVQHTPKPARIDVAVQPGHAQVEMVDVTIADQGPGIDPALVPTLFDRFARSTNSSGLGIGLYLARAIARAHGGDAELVSTSSLGTRIRLLLPLQPTGISQPDCPESGA
jgi:two-component system, OmpR family, sensor kinase